MRWPWVRRHGEGDGALGDEINGVNQERCEVNQIGNQTCVVDGFEVTLIMYSDVVDGKTQFECEVLVNKKGSGVLLKRTVDLPDHGKPPNLGWVEDVIEKVNVLIRRLGGTALDADDEEAVKDKAWLVMPETFKIYFRRKMVPLDPPSK